MRRALVLVAIAVLSILSIKGQETRTITLQMLYDAVEQNHPISGINPLLDSLKNLQIKNANASYLPKVDVNASASWQSDVTEVNIPFPGVTIPTPDRDQYRLSLDVGQIIWDGGVTSARKEIAIAQAEAEKSSVRTELYSLKDRVNEVYFSIILIDVTQKQLELMRTELASRLESLEAGVNNGVVLPSAIAGIKAEIIRLEQKMMELPSRKKSMISLLESLTQLDFYATDNFVPPIVNEANSSKLNRPELLTFTSQKSLFDARSSLVSKKRMPIISAFVSSGYGKPGLNMLSNEWNPYLMAGARLTWNIWDWNTTNREREQLSIQKRVIDQRLQAFEQGIESAVKSSDNQIETLTKQLELDSEIIELLYDVKRKSESQLANGVISSTEYLADFNAAARAKLDMEYRKILLNKEKVKLYYILGIDF
ncbi:TolC family protein [Perlabentimonas gracilis]|uniref:TolC family protein n=1 Tax=Perlabentimonas gracilis TaxID=2715279 RepID=UPI00140DA209|nr:TolC family protein [Perlabentimonas gracilis]NHB67267.1 TolC family protein [Perlabentimonas gracilis]